MNADSVPTVYSLMFCESYQNYANLSQSVNRATIYCDAS